MNNAFEDALKIWNAGVDAVRAQPLVENSVTVEGTQLSIDQHTWSLADFDRVVVVGAGKAGSAMAAGLVHAVGGPLPVLGWVNVPAGTERDVPGITTHPARPAGVNEPTEVGVAGTEKILELVQQSTSRDLVIALISGGGSALLPAPAPGITLEDKLAVTRLLSGGGADITELNTVRKHLSRIKGGGLLAACRDATLVTLILSDVLGDPLDMIASGPTVPDTTTPDDALELLAKFDPDRALPDRVYETLKDAPQKFDQPSCHHTNIVLGNNAVAVDEAGIMAESLGYNHAMQSARSCEGAAEDVGIGLARMVVEMLNQSPDQHRTDCLITGGEPTVTLAPSDIRGRGGRNQQLVLAAYQTLRGLDLDERDWDRLAILSGGTDGEDGPTDAAGAILNGAIHRQAMALNLDIADHLKRNDAYSFFEAAGGLIMTGPTGTNVCDVRVALVTS